MAFNRRAEIELAASNRKLKADLRQAEQDVAAFGRSAAGKLGGAFKTGLGGFAAFGAAAGFADLGRDVVKFEEKLVRVAIAADASGSDLNALRESVRKTAMATGMMPESVLGAVEALVDLEGKAGFSQEKMMLLARTAQAANAPIDDLAGVVFALGKSVKLGKVEDLEAALAAVITAGKEGSVPLGEMSRALQKIGSSFNKLTETGKLGAAQMASVIQVAREAFPSADEAATGISAFVTALTTKAKGLKKFKVRVFDVDKNGTKTMRDLGDILDDIGASKIARQPDLLAEAFGSAEAAKLATALLENRQRFDEMTAAAANSSNVIQKDLDRYLNSSVGRLNKKLVEARVRFEAMVTPERIEKFVDVVEDDLMPALDFVLEHGKSIAIAIASWKAAEGVVAAGKYAAAFHKAATSTSAASGAANALLGIVTKLGPLGLVASVATAVGAIGVAFYKATAEAKALTEEQIRQKVLAGETVGKITKSDMKGEADALRRSAAADRANVEKGNDLMLTGAGFEKMAIGGASGLSRDELARFRELRKHFLENSGVFSGEQQAEFDKLVAKGFRDQGMVAALQSAGGKGQKTLADADRKETRAAALEAVGKFTYGNTNIDPSKFNWKEAAGTVGISDPAQMQVFRDEVLRKLSDEMKLQPKLVLGEGGMGLQTLQADEQGNVTRGVSKPASLWQTLTDTLPKGATAAMRGNVEVSDKVVQKLDELVKAVQQQGPVSLKLDGKEVYRSTKGSPEGLRRSAK